MKQQLPYLTRNTALAVVAFLFRIPITRKRIYTQSFLEQSNLTAKEAYRRSQLGEIDYAIHTEGDETYTKIIKAFNDEKLRIEDGQDETELDCDPEVAARLACRVLYARKNFFRDLFALIPFIRIPMTGVPKKSAPDNNGAYTVTSPGFKDVRLDADSSTLKHLGL